MKLTAFEAARLIDISAVRTHSSSNDIIALADLARKYKFINIHTLPTWTKTLAQMLADVQDVYVGAPVGFPSGGHTCDIKLAEASQLIDDGVQEMDIVMNVGRFKNKEYGYVLDELKRIIAIASEKNILTKVIIEQNVLTDSEVEKACALVIDSGADFIKTGTGWVPGDAGIDRIKRIKEHCGSKIKVKAAGGIRSPQEFLELYEMGVERMGINAKSAVEIVEYLGC